MYSSRPINPPLSLNTIVPVPVRMARSSDLVGVDNYVARAAAIVRVHCPAFVWIESSE